LRSFIHSWKPMLLSYFLWPLHSIPLILKPLKKKLRDNDIWLSSWVSMRVCVKLVPCMKFNADVFLHQEGRALQSLEIRFFVLFWRRIIDFKKDETKKSLLCFRFWCASVYDDESFGFCLSISLACSLSYRILVLTVIWSYFISRYIFIFIAAWIFFRLVHQFNCSYKFHIFKKTKK